VPVVDGDGDVEDVEEADRVEARLPDVDVANSALMLTENEVADGCAELKDEYVLLLSAFERLATGLSAVAQQMLIWFVTCVHFSLGGVSNHSIRDLRYLFRFATRSRRLHRTTEECGLTFQANSRIYWCTVVVRRTGRHRFLCNRHSSPCSRLRRGRQDYSSSIY
jgi:hypothetical protein